MPGGSGAGRVVTGWPRSVRRRSVRAAARWARGRARAVETGDAMSRLDLLPVAMCGLLALAGRAQPVQGDLAALGFPAAGAQVLREGQWFPVRVHLAAPGGSVFAGALRLETVDLDGDRVAYMQKFTVGGDAGPKRVWCYGVVNRATELPAAVDVLNAGGVLVARLPLPPQPRLAILNDDLLVLDISEPPVPGLGQLETPRWMPGDRAEGERDFYRNVAVASLAARDLPDHWCGLEAVDVILWDRPDRSEISLAQLDALIAWVRSGGQLVVGIGAGWSGLESQPLLRRILPLQGPAATIELRRLRVFASRMGRADLAERELDRPLAVTAAAPAPDALTTVSEIDPTGAALALALVAMRPEGSGRVVATAASLRDLAAIPARAERFFREVLDLNRYPAAFKDSQREQMQGLAVPLALYGDVVRGVSHASQASAAKVFVFLFVAAYIAAATLASWWWLLRHRRTSLSWVVFALLAAGASGLSLLMVGGLRGLIARGVDVLSIVDLEAGASAARGPCLIGYASPLRQRVTLALPGEHDFLRPLTGSGLFQSRYVTPTRYAALPARATLDDVLVRATLKSLEGFWTGTLDGTVRGNLVVDRASGRLTPASWIANELPVDLAGGVLLLVDPRPREEPGVPPRAAGLDRPYTWRRPEPLEEDLAQVPPALNVLAVRVGRVPRSAQVDGLGRAQYQRVDRQQAEYLRGSGLKRSALLQGERDLPTLWHEQREWVRAVESPLGRDRLPRALLLASTRGLYLHNRGEDLAAAGVPLTTEGLPDLDITHWLLAGQAVLLAWAEDPGPVVLHVDGRPARSRRGLTFYRVRLPLRYAEGGGRPGELP